MDEPGLRGPNAEAGSGVADRHDRRDGLPPVAAAMLAATADPAAVPLEAAAALERRFSDRPAIDVLVPDGTTLRAALARTTDLGVGAHPDDLELLMLVPIGLCRGRSDRWFAGVTATDGAGSVRTGRFAGLSDAALAAVRRSEQREAGALGGYGSLVQLGHASAGVRSGGGERRALVDDLVALLRATRPVNVYTHNLADKHATHVAVGAAVVQAIRRLDPADRPQRLVGMEGWRDLDWLADHEKVILDASSYGPLGRRLAACFASQIESGKRYDRALEGRRWANATLAEPRATDEAEAVTVAMDLSPLVRNDDLDPAAFVAAAADRFRRDIETQVAAAFTDG
jgi:LmbE family N-acetylglucosaminyl deacetylase